MSDMKKRIFERLNQPGFFDHKAPVTRRDFIKLGLMAGGGALMPYGVVERALAQGLAKPTLPFMVIDLAGGAGLSTNILGGLAGGPEDLAADYRKHGWNPRASNALQLNYGVPMNLQSGEFLKGLESVLPEELKQPGQQNFKISSIIHFAIDDTNTNKASALTSISRAGLRGMYMNSGISAGASGSGGNADSLLSDSKYSPKFVKSPQDVVSLTSFGVQYEELPAKSRAQIFAQLKEASGANQALREIYQELSNFGISQPKLDPSKSEAMSSIYQGLNDNSGLYIQAAIAWNVLQGHTGPGVFTIDNCDYHQPNQPQLAVAKDNEIGVALGRVIASAHALKKPVFVQIITDGGVYSQPSDSYERRWVGDANQHTMSLMAYYNPVKAVEQRRIQLGHFTKDATVEFKTIVGKDAESAAKAVIVNYLHLQGLTGQIEQLTGMRLQPQEIEAMLAFA